MLMKLNNTIEMMNSDDFKERFRAEYFQLKIRIEGLTIMLANYKAGTLNFTPKCSYEILHDQLDVMVQYMTILRARAVIEGIELD